MKDLFQVAVIMFFIFGGVILFSFFSDKKTCEKKAAAMSMASKWGFWERCIVEYKPGQWIPIERYRVIE